MAVHRASGFRARTAVASVWLAATAVLPAAASTATADSPVIPLVRGLVFTTTLHASLVASTGSAPLADTEIVYSVERADSDRVDFSLTVSAPGDSSARKLLDPVPHSFERTVRREDLRSAARLTVHLSSTDPSLMPGQTFAGTSIAVLQALHDPGHVAFVLGVNEPEQGFAAPASAAKPSSSGGATSDAYAMLSSMFSSLSLSRHYYRGTLQRVGTADEPFSLLLDGRRTAVPAVHVRGQLQFNSREITPELWWLDDARNPLTLKWAIGDVYEIVTRIDPPVVQGNSQSAQSAGVADGLAGKHCRGELAGVYFTTASAEILDASIPALERFAAAMRQHPAWQVTIEGHTDNIGSAESNLDLSDRRAEAVRNLLIQRFAVPTAQLRAKGYGLSRPVEANATDQGRAHNRRVEVSRQCGDGAPSPPTAGAFQP
jgi:outer membrane protein OmpA-like peptidoglycan-associated protein